MIGAIACLEGLCVLNNNLVYFKRFRNKVISLQSSHLDSSHPICYTWLLSHNVADVSLGVRLLKNGQQKKSPLFD